MKNYKAMWGELRNYLTDWKFDCDISLRHSILKHILAKMTALDSEAKEVKSFNKISIEPEKLERLREHAVKQSMRLLLPDEVREEHLFIFELIEAYKQQEIILAKLESEAKDECCE